MMWNYSSHHALGDVNWQNDTIRSMTMLSRKHWITAHIEENLNT